MNERDQLNAAITQLDETIDVLAQLRISAKITPKQEQRARLAILGKQQSLFSRLETLILTGTGITPIPTTKKVNDLRNAVAKLGAINAAGDAFNDALATVLEAAEAFETVSAAAQKSPGSALLSASISSGAETLFAAARDDLRVRAGPGTNYDIKTSQLKFGTPVRPLRSVDGWTLIDRVGDGKGDGFVSSGWLMDQVAISAAIGSAAETVIPAATADSTFLAALIAAGSSPAGLKQARATAAKALSGYPTNGCAVHLSALLQQAEIDVPMTFGAGKLAHILSERGWRRVLSGSQQPGDVGVCFDNTAPPGADHVYLVLSTQGADKMVIADNQNDEPHQRFASGAGKTPTEYFLRA